MRIPLREFLPPVDFIGASKLGWNLTGKFLASLLVTSSAIVFDFAGEAFILFNSLVSGEEEPLGSNFESFWTFDISLLKTCESCGTCFPNIAAVLFELVVSDGEMRMAGTDCFGIV